MEKKAAVLIGLIARLGVDRRSPMAPALDMAVSLWQP